MQNERIYQMSSNWNILLKNGQHSLNVYEPEVPRLRTMGNIYTNFKIWHQLKFGDECSLCE